MSDYIPATPANMRKYPGLSALDLDSYQAFSANAEDYFWQPDDEPLTNEAGAPLILAVTLRERHEPFVP